jgi:hypothetical protein
MIVRGDLLRERRILSLGAAMTTLSGLLLLLLLRGLLEPPWTITWRRSDRGLRLSPEAGIIIGLRLRLSRLGPRLSRSSSPSTTVGRPLREERGAREERPPTMSCSGEGERDSLRDIVCTISGEPERE